MGAKISHVGETRVMNCGMKATIIAYRNSRDIDVQFEDGTVVQYKRYDAFTINSIAHPNICTKSSIYAKQYTGISKIMNCGLEATIVVYRNSADIDVIFSDGTVVEHRTYQAFQRGQIGNPNYKTFISSSCNELTCLYYLQQLGFRKAKRGELPELQGKELDFYHPNINGHKVAIEYDGYINNKNLGHTLERDLEKNRLCKKASIALFRIREPQLPQLNSTSKNYYLSTSKIQSNSLEKIIKLLINDINNMFQSNFELNIDFQKDKNSIQQFINTYHNLYESRIGESKIMKCKLKATIVAYRKADDIDVQFEDGTVVQHRAYHAFKIGTIGHPNIHTQTSIHEKQRIGESKIMKCGLKATIVAYKKNHDIDIQFEDRTIVKHKNYGAFLRGEIGYPGRYKIKYVGETRIMNNGMKATIIDYRSRRDIDVKFEDGTVVKHKKHSTFNNGKIAHPNYDTLLIKNITNHLGESKTMRCGIKSRLISYRGYDDIDILFDNNILVSHVKYQTFYNGNMNPNCNRYKHKTQLTKEEADKLRASLPLQTS